MREKRKKPEQDWVATEYPYEEEDTFMSETEDTNLSKIGVPLNTGLLGIVRSMDGINNQRTINTQCNYQRLHSLHNFFKIQKNQQQNMINTECDFISNL